MSSIWLGGRAEPPEGSCASQAWGIEGLSTTRQLGMWGWLVSLQKARSSLSLFHQNPINTCNCGQVVLFVPALAASVVDSLLPVCSTTSSASLLNHALLFAGVVSN